MPGIAKAHKVKSNMTERRFLKANMTERRFYQALDLWLEVKQHATEFERFIGMSVREALSRGSWGFLYLPEETVRKLELLLGPHGETIIAMHYAKHTSMEVAE